MATLPPAWHAAMRAGTDHARAGRLPQAAVEFGKATKLVPDSSIGWQSLGLVEHQRRNWSAANTAHMQMARLAPADPKLKDAAGAIRANRPADAQRILQERLRESPNNVAAMMLMADLARRAARPDEAAKILYHIVDLAPGFVPAWPQLAAALGQLSAPDALARAQAQAERRPDVEGHQTMVAAMLERNLEFEAALAKVDGIRARQPGQAQPWIATGHLRKTLGDAAGAALAYRQALEFTPKSGEAWWALADMKSQRFTAEDRAAMEALATEEGQPANDRIMLLFALGRARELDGDEDAAFAAYQQGNSLRRAALPQTADRQAEELRGLREILTPQWFADRQGGAAGADPIFIVGLPRSGSTLVEQILASHPQVEATMELHELPALLREAIVAERKPWPQLLEGLTADKLTAMGEAYLARTRTLRKTDRPFFIDKLPANFRQIGLIHAILPNAKVIDVRRAPEPCGWSIFRQYFSSGYAFAWDLGDIGRWYRDYLQTMALWEDLLPGFVHRVEYERLVEQPEAEVRALLDHLGLPYDPACLAFHQTARPVRTPSGDQVRQPINRRGVEDWLPYAAHLAPLRDALAH